MRALTYRMRVRASAIRQHIRNGEAELAKNRARLQAHDGIEVLALRAPASAGEIAEPSYTRFGRSGQKRPEGER